MSTVCSPVSLDQLLLCCSFSMFWFYSLQLGTANRYINSAQLLKIIPRSYFFSSERTMCIRRGRWLTRDDKAAALPSHFARKYMKGSPSSPPTPIVLFSHKTLCKPLLRPKCCFQSHNLMFTISAASLAWSPGLHFTLTSSIFIPLMWWLRQRIKFLKMWARTTPSALNLRFSLIRCALRRDEI